MHTYIRVAYKLAVCLETEGRRGEGRGREGRSCVIDHVINFRAGQSSIPSFLLT